MLITVDFHYKALGKVMYPFLGVFIRTKNLCTTITLGPVWFEKIDTLLIFNSISILTDTSNLPDAFYR
jgi:hypothetical protein